MSEEISIEGFYEKAIKGEIYTSQCFECGNLSIPPRRICHRCGSSNSKLKKVSNEGVVESYTVIHVPPKRLEKEAPYVVCLVKLDEGPKILARMKANVSLKIGDRVKIKTEYSKSESWPDWPVFIAEVL